MTKKEARMLANFIEVAGFESAPRLLEAVNAASVTHHFVVARDDKAAWLIGAYDIALDRWLVSGCGKKFTPLEWAEHFTQETL
jgi:hypothetical protein